MSAEIEVKDGNVTKDGEFVGVVADGKFVPNDGLHYKTVGLIERHLEGYAEPLPEVTIEGGGVALHEIPGGTPVDPDSIEKPPKLAPDGSVNDPEPVRTERGDIDIDLIEWRRRNWAEADFNQVYPKTRLRMLDL